MSTYVYINVFFFIVNDFSEIFNVFFKISSEEIDDLIVKSFTGRNSGPISYSKTQILES